MSESGISENAWNTLAAKRKFRCDMTSGTVFLKTHLTDPPSSWIGLVHIFAEVHAIVSFVASQGLIGVLVEPALEGVNGAVSKQKLHAAGM